jgi:hypothetical protein
MCRLEMACQNLMLVYPIIGEKSIGCFGVRSVLTGHGDALSRTLSQLPQQDLKSLVQSLIFELAPGKFPPDPILRRAFIGDTSPPLFWNRFVRHATPRASLTRNGIVSHIIL